MKNERLLKQLADAGEEALFALGQIEKILDENP